MLSQSSGYRATTSNTAYVDKLIYGR